MRVDPAKPLALTAESFASLMAPFAPFESAPTVAVAVSGGRDSLALALLAHDWCRQRRGQAIGLIVDHGLRVESTAEASATRALLGERGIASAILRWTGPKPAHGLQAAARAARYRLLLEACRERDVVHLLVAHHAGDQAETVAMRAARHSGPDGLAGMAAAVEHREARLLRPLLGIARARLTATLQLRGVAWIDDPSNVDLGFERVRLRRGETALPMPGERHGVERLVREQALAETAVALVEFDGDGAAAIDHAAFTGLRAEIAASLLSRLVQAVAGRDHPPRRDRLARAVSRLSQGGNRGKSGKSQDFTLSGCRLSLRQTAGERRLRWIVRPENGRKDRRKGGQPLVPAAFFPCGGAAASHLD